MIRAASERSIPVGDGQRCCTLERVEHGEDKPNPAQRPERWPRIGVWLTGVSTLAVTALVGRWMYAASRLLPWTEFDPENPPLRFYVTLLWLVALVVNIRITMGQERLSIGVGVCTLWSILLVAAASTAAGLHVPARVRFSFEKATLASHVELAMEGPADGSISIDDNVLGWPCRGAWREGANVEFYVDCRDGNPAMPYRIIFIWSPRGDPGLQKGRGWPISIGDGWYFVHGHI